MRLLSRTVLVAVVMVLLLLGGACAPKEEAPAAAPITLRASMHLPEDHYRTVVMKYWMDLVEERSNGRITFDFYSAGTLHSAKESWDALTVGTTDVTFLVGGYIAGKVPQLAIFDVPWALKSEKWGEIYNKASSIVDTEVFAPNNVKLLWGNRPGHYLFATRDKFIHSPDDFKGMKIRSGGGFMDKAYQTWGAAVVSLPIGEIYPALQRGVVDATGITYDTYGKYKFDEVVPNITLWKLTAMYLPYAMNLDTWNTLSKADQDLILKAGEEAQIKSDEVEDSRDPEIIEKYKALGCAVYEMTDKEVALFVKSIEPLWDEARARGATAAKLVDICEKYQ